MQNLFFEAMKRFKRCSSTKTVKRCNQTSLYMGLTPPVRWARPNHSRMEGPFHYGLANPGCSDMRSWWITIACPKAGPGVTIEYLGVEFARDVAMQSTVAPTTQESTAIYLRGRPPPSVVVFNVGLHDVVVGTSPPNVADRPWPDIYEENLRWFLSLLRPALAPGARFVHLTTTTIRDSEDIAPQYNPAVADFNARLRRVAVAEGHLVLDVTPLLVGDGQRLYSDRMHLRGEGGAYYRAVLDLILRRLDPSSAVRT